jgi:phage shock protein C
MENTAASTPAPAPRLYRSATEKVIGGVCGGLAAYFKIDPTIVRLAFVVFALAGGASILLYILLWIAVPLGDGTATSIVSRPLNNEAIAVVLIGVGAIWLLANTGVLRLVNWSFAWPLALVALGIALLVRRS